MKVKDLERTANIAWSPRNQHPILLAAGTAAQQLDASFNTSSTLELYALNLDDPGPDMELKASVPSEHRFHKITWGPYGKDPSNGTIVGGCDGGVIQIYNASKILKGEDGFISRQSKHAGPVSAIDFNPFQSNLLASGATDSEIFIWDLNNITTPMSPGVKSQPLEDILCVAWNRQVQHILASAFSSRCVVWDLRKNEPIIKLSDTVSRIRWKVVAWHPEVATQLCLASEEDQAPVIQLWDLRFATSPLKTLENHQRGVLSIAWCSQDPDLLVSCGKDNRIVCWNPNSAQAGGEVLSEVAKTNQWNFDVAWCPRNPALIASPSFDGHISVYSLMGGALQQVQTSNKIADSFPGMEGYAQAPVQQNVAPVSVDLTKPPKWLKKPVGAVFGFGGKLIMFENDKTAAVQMQQKLQPGQVVPTAARIVYISQVITEPEIVDKSAELEKALEYGNFIEYCQRKADSLTDQHKKYIWHFLKAHFEANPRAEFLNLLGYRIEDINAKLNQHIDNNVAMHVDNLNEQFSHMNDPKGYEKSSFDNIDGQKLQNAPFKIKTGEDIEGLITQALLLGNVEAAVELCLKANRFTDAIIIAMTGGSDLLARTQCKYLQQTDGYLSSLITALVSEDWASIINNCDINSWKEALAATLTHSTDEDLPNLCEQLGNRLVQKSHDCPKLSQDAQLCYICAGSFDRLVGSWSSGNIQSSNELQELVELVTFLQKAIERQGRVVEVTGNLADLVTQYASILASQGDFTTALNYLGSSKNEHVINLRERLLVSLGHKPTYGQAQVRKTSDRLSFTSYPNHVGQPNQFNQNYGQFNTGLPSANVGQPWQQPTALSGAHVQPPKPFSPAPSVPPTQPPRPTSVGSAHGGSSITSRSKYILDPSVQLNQYGSRNQYGANAVSPPQPFGSNPTPSFQTNALNPAPSPYVNQIPPAPQPSAANTPLNPSLPPSANAPFNSIPLSPNPQNFPAPVQNQPSFQNNAVLGGFNQGFDQCEVAQRQPLSAMNILPASAAPGWNDPPMLHKSTKMQAKQDYSSKDPITHPLYGATPIQNNPQNNGYSDSIPPLPYGQFPTHNQTQMFQPLTPGSFNQQPPNVGQLQRGLVPQSSGFNTQAVNQSVFQPGVQEVQQPQEVQALPEKPQPIQKPPIPEEHVHMQTVFDELKVRCSCAANNPQTKRKLEDVSKKLETLYDLLREHKLSPNTLTALHQVVELIEAGDYVGGLNLHTQLVSGPDFAQIASFMPGLKVLLQCALQLQVYIR